MLKEARVVVIPGDAFGLSGKGRVRFSFAGQPEQIEEGFNRLSEWLKNLK
jgi:aminotransferase